MRESTTRHLQSLLPSAVHRALRDLSYETGRSMSDLAFDGVLLVLRYHDRGHELPGPLPPSFVDRTDTEMDTQVSVHVGPSDDTGSAGGTWWRCRVCTRRPRGSTFFSTRRLGEDPQHLPVAVFDGLGFKLREFPTVEQAIAAVRVPPRLRGPQVYRIETDKPRTRTVLVVAMLDGQIRTKELPRRSKRMRRTAWDHLLLDDVDDLPGTWNPSPCEPLGESWAPTAWEHILRDAERDGDLGHAER
jgi:hypothetical protein